MSLEYKKWLTFLSFVIIAALLWFVYKYKEVYTEHLLVEVLWINVPSNIKLDEEAVYEIDMELTGTGFDLIMFSYFSPEVTLDFTKYVYKKNDHYYLNPQTATNSFKNQLNNKFKIDYITDEVIQINVTEYLSKKVPLSAVFNTSYTRSLKPVKIPFFNPDSVVISGNDNVVSSINVLEVKNENLVVQDTLVKLKLNLSQQFPDLKVVPSNVEYVIETSVMTEGDFLIPVSIINKPNGITTKIIPSEVKVVFNCQLKEFKKVKESDFVINIDYNDLKNDYNIMPVSVESLNEVVTSTRLSVQQVQILLIQ